MPKHRRSSIVGEIAVLRRVFRMLDQSLRRLGPMLVSATVRSNGKHANEGPRRLRLSAKARVALKLQGRYMGYVRQLKPRQKARIRKIREAKGVRVAIARAMGMVR